MTLHITNQISVYTTALNWVMHNLFLHFLWEKDLNIKQKTRCRRTAARFLHGETGTGIYYFDFWRISDRQKMFFNQLITQTSLHLLLWRQSVQTVPLYFSESYFYETECSASESLILFVYFSTSSRKQS